MIIKQRIQKADGSIRFRNYLRQERLGKGGFAECFTVERMEDKKLFALKIINKKNLQKPKAKQKMISEIQLHKQVRHKSICQLDRAFEDEQNVYMLLQLCTNGNMFDLIKKRKRLTIPETQYFLYQIIDGLCYLHNKQIIHRDIKLGNLLVNGKMELKLADFGLATKLEFQGDKKHTVCGTPNYIAPEVIMSSMGMGVSGHSYEVDVWSTGVIMYLMLCGKAPFETPRVEKTYERITRAEFSFPDYFKDANGKDLLKKILVVDGSKRLTFEQILSHEFMNPKHGIPKQIPLTCMSSAPKFDSKYEQIESSTVKESARNFSINTLRSEVDLSLDEHNFEGLAGFAKRDEKSKDIKGLLKTVLSTSSLSRSLQKLGNISRSISPQSRQLKPKLFTGSSSRQKNPIRERVSSTASTDQREKMFRDNPSKLSSNVYILEYKREIISSYLLSSGYVGTYEPNYKLIYNKREDLYFESVGDSQLKRLKSDSVLSNQNVQNRKKFIKHFTNYTMQCQPFMNTARVVYLKRTFEIKSEGIIMFKLSNNHIQVRHQDLNKILLITKDQLVLITVEKGREVQQVTYPRENYIDCPDKDLIHLYLKFKKISSQINAKK